MTAESDGSPRILVRYSLTDEEGSRPPRRSV